MLPYGLPLAPARQPRTSAPIDLGEFNEEYRGWFVIVYLDVPIGALKQLSSGQSVELMTMAENLDDLPLEQKIHLVQQGIGQVEAMAKYVKSSVAAWNFTHFVPGGEIEPIPQPDAGGVDYLSPELLGLIVRAIANAQRPPKN